MAIRLRILIIDDEPHWLEFAKRDLNKFEVVVASDTRTALAELVTNQFDLVIASSRRLDVLEVIVRRCSYTRVVVTTVQPTTREALAAYRVGAIRYFPKSFGRQDLFNHVRDVILAFAGTDRPSAEQEGVREMADKRDRILVVDDLADWRDTLRGLLVDAGYDVLAADSYTSALGLLEAGRLDLAVLDIRLDETDEANMAGLDLAAEIKHRWPAVKVVILTGYDTPAAMRQAREPDVHGQALAADYIPKTQAEELAQVVWRVLRNKMRCS
jgi:DNA-binding NtrC family response regulator